MRLAVISDTHLPRGARRLPDACVAELAAADAILHAGDLMEAGVLEALQRLGPPVHAVRGNVDSAELQARLPATRMVNADGARIAMLHDAGPAIGRLARMHRRFPDAHAVVFNVDEPDLQMMLPRVRTLDAGGARIAIIHDAGPSAGRLERMRRTFPDADAVVFGHSHIPLHEERDGFQIFNPGSPTERRRQPRHTMGIATAHDGRVAFELITLD